MATFKAQDSDKFWTVIITDADLKVILQKASCTEFALLSIEMEANSKVNMSTELGMEKVSFIAAQNVSYIVSGSIM